MTQAKGNPYGFRPSEKTLDWLHMLMGREDVNVTEVIEKAIKQAAKHEASLEPLLNEMLGEKSGSYRRNKPQVNPLYFRPSKKTKEDIESFMAQQNLNKTDVVEACIAWYFLRVNSLLRKVRTAA